MSLKKTDPINKERRTYIRLDSVFPVQFRLMSLDGEHFLCDWQQGFTYNIGKGGICLSVNNLYPGLAELIKTKQAKLFLEIQMPLTSDPVCARSAVAWVKDLPGQNKYLIGISYEAMEPAENKRIMRYAITKRFLLPAALSLLVVLGAGFIVNSIFSLKLAGDNRALVEKLVKINQEARLAKERMEEISWERESLQKKISELSGEIEAISRQEKETQANKEAESALTARKLEEFTRQIEELNKEKQSFKAQLVSIQKREEAINKEFAVLAGKKVGLEKANLGKMYQWLSVHQNPRTGLVASFEGDNDVADWAFIYDQSLAAQAFTNSLDFERAKKIFEFFSKRAKRQNNSFYNAYYAAEASPAEFSVHSGPNIWLGIAILQYTGKTKDRSYLVLAEDIAVTILELQSKDSEGGIRGGPGLEWYSTEHNLDAYAFFNMLYSVTGNAKYKEAADRVLSWLTLHTYDRGQPTIKRGKGDSTIATDTYAWSIAALGPDKLNEIGMDPDKVLEFAEDFCAVEVSFVRPEGRSVRVKGFDFAAQKNLGRGGVVSSEWTAQMIIAFRIMADYYRLKGDSAKVSLYSQKAQGYLSALGNLIISSPSPSGQGESCLVYATQDFVDTGHGWFTPKGKSTGSVAGTVYTLFASYNYNPLKLKD